MNATLGQAEQLIARASVTPDDAGCQDLAATRLRDASIHPIDERVELASVDPLKNVYRRTLELLLA